MISIYLNSGFHSLDICARIAFPKRIANTSRMGTRAYLELLSVVLLLFDGVWFNRASGTSLSGGNRPGQRTSLTSDRKQPGKGNEMMMMDRSLSPSLLAPQESTWKWCRLSILEV